MQRDAPAPPSNVTCEDKNNSTVVSVRSPEGKNLLMALTGVFSFLDLQVVSASIKTSDSGFILDEFVVQSADGSSVRSLTLSVFCWSYRAHAL